MRKLSTWVTALTVAASVVATAPKALAADVKIGVLFPLTGNAAAAGQASKAAVEVAAEIINGKHPELANIPLAAEEGLPGLGGAKIELIIVDHQGNPAEAQQQALRLVSQDKVNALFGAYQSSCSSRRPRWASATAFRSWSAIPPRATSPAAASNGSVASRRSRAIMPRTICASSPT